MSTRGKPRESRLLSPRSPEASLQLG